MASFIRMSTCTREEWSWSKTLWTGEKAESWRAEDKERERQKENEIWMPLSWPFNFQPLWANIFDVMVIFPTGPDFGTGQLGPGPVNFDRSQKSDRSRPVKITMFLGFEVKETINWLVRSRKIGCEVSLRLVQKTALILCCFQGF